ncbi:hypothetical protein VTK73DRAFT_10166 [Phialemonium thermophilum]|uniref:Uncharacterized protein n=1 Tax=Phialemonium thermophilum TaxID=223376 RepID=A0ABR3VY36_9PEZI
MLCLHDWASIVVYASSSPWPQWSFSFGWDGDCGARGPGHGRWEMGNPKRGTLPSNGDNQPTRKRAAQTRTARQGVRGQIVRGLREGLVAEPRRKSLHIGSCSPVSRVHGTAVPRSHRRYLVFREDGSGGWGSDRTWSNGRGGMEMEVGKQKKKKKKRGGPATRPQKLCFLGRFFNPGRQDPDRE